MPMVFRSASAGSMSSLNSAAASRPIRNSAPDSGARMLSPEQSANTFASTVCQVSVVVCQPVTLLIRSPSMSRRLQEQLRSSVRFGSKRAFSYRMLSQSE